MNPLISVSELASLIPHGEVRIIDARFRLKDPAIAERLFQEGHIPGALRVDLEKDLSGEKTGTNGRHPFPAPESLAALFSRLGITNTTSVVVYDDADHSGAARFWFLMRWMGHERVRVLDGGLKAWLEEGMEAEKGPHMVLAASSFTRRPSLVKVFSSKELQGKNLVDARAPERYRGEIEPIDPKAGHIPGAKNLFYTTLLGADGKFLPIDLLEKKLADFVAPVFYCGSGVTGCVPVLASSVLGRDAALYPGSWSEWCSLPGAEVSCSDE